MISSSYRAICDESPFQIGYFSINIEEVRMEQYHKLYWLIGNLLYFHSNSTTLQSNGCCWTVCGYSNIRENSFSFICNISRILFRVKYLYSLQRYSDKWNLCDSFYLLKINLNKTLLRIIITSTTDEQKANIGMLKHLRYCNNHIMPPDWLWWKRSYEKQFMLVKRVFVGIIPFSQVCDVMLSMYTV